ncbi:MAG: hypothetical protein AAGF30_01320 [Pseudomonadota bacterium]
MDSDPSVLSSPAATEAQRRARARARLADTARLLPFLGAVLFLAPDLILSGHPAGEGATAPWSNYLFATWLLLIGLAAWIARRHLRDGDPDRSP